MLTTLLQSLPEFDPAIAEEFGYAAVSGNSFLGVPIMETQSFLHLLLKFAFNLVVSLVVVGLLYYRRNGRKEYFLTFMLFSSAMFLLLVLMENVKLQIGFTLGLFAIFGMIRYRTETVPVREMTYLFVIIALSVINGISLTISYAELLLANVLQVLLIWACEAFKSRIRTSTKLVVYDRIELVKKEKRDELIADLRDRLSLDVVDVQVGRVDLLKDSALLEVKYRTPDGKPNNVDHIQRTKDYV